MKSLKLPLILLTLALSTAASANPLYSWTTKDGTPTYSPDPPPEGTKYEIVGADLKPIAGQPTPPAKPSSPAQDTVVKAEAVAGDKIVLTPAPGSRDTAAAQTTARSTRTAPPPKWQPVIYADDPNPKALKQEFNATAATPEALAPLNQVSDACINFKQQVILLESQFAHAISAKEMDDAVVRLNIFRKQNKGNC